jgi:hypothetical protein
MTKLPTFNMTEPTQPTPTVSGGSSRLPAFALDEPTQPTPTVSEGSSRLPAFALDEPTPAGPSISPKDLYSPESKKTILAHMANRYGEARYNTSSDSTRMVDAFVNDMRRYDAGQSVVTLGEFNYILGATDEQKADSSKAYELFGSLSGIFSEGYTAADNFDALKDYARAAVIDPVNLISLGVGKIVGFAGTKAASQAIKLMAKKGALAVAQRTAKGAVVKKGAVELLERRLTERVMKGQGFKQLAKKKAILGIAGTTAFDTAAAVGTDYAYQSGMIDVGVQEDYSAIQGGLAALGGLIGGGIALGTSGKALRGIGHDTPMLASLVGSSNPKLVAKKIDAKGVVNSMIETLEAFKMNEGALEPFSNKVGRGKDLQRIDPISQTDLEGSFWRYFILGNDEVGARGLAGALQDHGMVWNGPRFQGDNVTNWMLDITRNLPKEELDHFTAAFKKNIGSRIHKYEKMSVEDFADAIAAKVHDAGSTLQISSEVAKRLGREDITYQDALEEALGAVVSKAAVSEEGLLKKIGKVAMYIQHNYIRSLITSLGTTALNLKGWAFNSTLQSATDMVHMSVLHGASLLGTKNADEFASAARSLRLANVAKMQNLINPHATYEAFLSYMAARPNVKRELLKYTSGGVDNKAMEGVVGFDPATTKLGAGFDKGLDFIQDLYLVKAQDVYTKSQEFFYNMEKQIQKNYKVGFKEFLETPELRAKMSSEEFLAMEIRAMTETERAVFSKSMAKAHIDAKPGDTKNLLHLLARTVEEARNYPVIGTVVPFGKFFNNTLALIADYSPLTLIGKMGGMTQERSYGELLSKAVVGFAAIGTYTAMEMENMDNGFAWYEKSDGGGGKIDMRLDFPANWFSIAGRYMAYKIRGQDVPDGLHEQILKDFGLAAITRGITDLEGDLRDFIYKVENGEGVEGSIEMVAKSASQYAAGYTRFLDPVNQMVAVGKGKDYAPIDRRQGKKLLNNALRYTDQIFGVLLGETKPQVTAAGGVEPTKNQFGPLMSARTVEYTTWTQKAMNLIDKPHYQASLYSKSPESDWVINNVIAPILEEKMKTLLTSTNFQEMGTRQKEKAINSRIIAAQKDARELLTHSNVPTDRGSAALYKLLSTHSTRTLDNAMEDLNMEGDLSDLSEGQLDLLGFYIQGAPERLEYDLVNP